MSTGDLVLALDASTTACKAIVFDAVGQSHGNGRAPLELSNPAPDGYEQDAESWWLSSMQAMREAIAELGGDRAGDVRAISIAHQRETFVLTDADCHPLHPALVWMDARCRPQVARAVRKLGRERLHEISGKPPCTTPSLYKLLFLLDARPELIERRPRVLDVSAFLSLRLTGEFKTSWASADPLGMIDMRRRVWSKDLLELANLPADSLPELVMPGSILGSLLPERARELGLPAPIPLIAGAGDGQAAGLGAGITAAGRAYLNLGTAIVSGVLSPSYATNSAFRTLYAAAPEGYFLETDLKGGTFTLNWLVEKLLRSGERGISVDAALSDLEAEAKTIGAGADGLVMVPYWNGVMNPYWDDTATGTALGFHGGHGPAHLYRAILEGIAFEQRLCTTGVETAIATSIDEIIVLGGGSKSDLWCQILADVLGKRIVRAGTHEATALGAGILAAVGAGLHPDLPAAVAAMTRPGEAFDSGSARQFYARLYDEVYAGLYPSIAERLARLSRIRA